MDEALYRGGDRLFRDRGCDRGLRVLLGSRLVSEAQTMVAEIRSMAASVQGWFRSATSSCDRCSRHASSSK
jgi:hypothetical protein